VRRPERVAAFFATTVAVRSAVRGRPYAGRHRSDAAELVDAERGSAGDPQLLGLPLGDPHRVSADLIPGGDLRDRDDDPNIRRI
jgi:hypothetical protein